MNKTKTNFKKLCLKYLKELKNLYFTDEYKIIITYKDKDENIKNDFTVNISILPDVVYLRLYIKIYPNMFRIWKQNGNEELLKSLNHEMAHTLTEPLYLLSCDLLDGKLVTNKHLEEVRERQTQRIAGIIYTTWKDN